MKLGKFLTLGAVAGMATAAVATTAVTSANTYGILALAETSSSDLVISVPWVDCEDSSLNTLVSNVVKTTNLTAGDYIIRKSGSTYQSWVLAGESSALYWKPQVIADLGVTTTTDGADTARMARGDALWLHRQAPSTSSPIYLFGQYSSEAASTTLSAGVMTLVASPSATALSLSDINSKFSPAKGDILITIGSSSKTYTYSGSAWTYKVEGDTGFTLPGGASATAVTTATLSSLSIPAGSGFWYKAKSAKTVNW